MLMFSLHLLEHNQMDMMQFLFRLLKVLFL